MGATLEFLLKEHWGDILFLVDIQFIIFKRSKKREPLSLLSLRIPWQFWKAYEEVDF